MISTLARLVVAHCICDYALQPSSFFKWKYESWWGMFAHAVVQAYGVYWATGSVVCAGIELWIHFTLDEMKRIGMINASQDQIGHYLTKVIYALFVG